MPMTTKDIFRKYTDASTYEKITEMDSISQMWTRCIKEYSDLNAVDFNGTKHTYAQLENDAAEFRGNLKSRGIEKGSRIGVVCLNSYEFIVAFIAITTSGNSITIIPPHLDAMTVFGCCVKYNLKALFVPSGLEEKASVAKAKGICVMSLSERGPKTELEETKKDAECALMFTGGTTGRSKAAILTNQAVMQGTVNGCYAYREVFHQRYILVLPLFHVFGLIRNLLTSLYTGSEIFICKNNKDMFKDIAVFRPTILVAVPALIEMALNLSKQFKKNMLGPDMKYVIAGAAAVSPYLIKEWKELFNVTVFPGYGLTESANLVSGNPENITKSDSVGILYPNQEYKIVDGELWLKGLNMLTEYAGEPEENQLAFEDGWFKTGDLVKFDQDGFLYITGRIKEIIVLPSGENISPAEVELKFNQLDLVQDSQVFEDIDENGKHFLALEVVPRATEMAKLESEDKGKYLTEKLQEINQTLPGFQKVSKITIRTSDFERTPSMKIKRYKKCN